MRVHLHKNFITPGSRSGVFRYDDVFVRRWFVISVVFYIRAYRGYFKSGSYPVYFLMTGTRNVICCTSVSIIQGFVTSRFNCIDGTCILYEGPTP